MTRRRRPTGAGRSPIPSRSKPVVLPVGLTVLAVLAGALALVLGLLVPPGGLSTDRPRPVGATPVGANPAPASMLIMPSTAANALDTDYPVPSGAVFASVDGRDGAPGTLSEPVRTVAEAIRIAPAGGTVVLRGGVYREGSTDWVTKSLTVQAFPHEQVWLDGTDVVTDWAPEAPGLWSTPWSTPEFCGGRYYERALDDQTAAGPCAHPDMTPVGDEVTADPQLAFVDGQPLRQFATPEQARAGGGFSYDRDRRVLSLGVDPNGHLVELSRRPTGLAVYGGAAHPVTFTVRGIGFRRYATNEYTNQTSGALVLNQTSGGLIDHVVVSQNAGGGLLTWQASELTIRSSMFDDNGYTGLWVDGSAKTGQADDLTLEYSRLDGNNTAGFGDRCVASCGAAGAKMSALVGARIRDNTFSGNHAAAGGFWCDTRCDRVAFSGNAVLSNGHFGVRYELSQGGLIVDNLIARNGWYDNGEGVMVGSAHTWIYHNSILDNAANVLLYDDARSNGSGGLRDLPPDSTDIRFVNNVVAGGSPSRPQVDVRAGDPTVATNTSPTMFLADADDNSYYRPPGTARWLYYFEETIDNHELYQSLPALTAARGIEAHSQTDSTGTNPYLRDPAAGDDTPTGREPVQQPPASVLDLLDRSADEPLRRGAIGFGGTGSLQTDLPAQAATSISPGQLLRASWHGAPVARVVLDLDGQPVSAVDGSGPYHLTLPADLPAGSSELTFTALDGRGRVVGALTRPVLVGG